MVVTIIVVAAVVEVMVSLYSPYLILRIDISAVCNQCVDNITVSVVGGPHQCCVVALRCRQHNGERNNTDITNERDSDDEGG